MGRQPGPGQHCTLQRTVSSYTALKHTRAHVHIWHDYYSEMHAAIHISSRNNAKEIKEKNELKTQTLVILVMVINKRVIASEKHSALLFCGLPVGSGFFILNCAARALTSEVQPRFASDWLAGVWQQLVARWPLPSVGCQCCWVKVKLKVSDEFPDCRWWAKQ